MLAVALALLAGCARSPPDGPSAGGSTQSGDSRGDTRGSRRTPPASAALDAEDHIITSGGARIAVNLDPALAQDPADVLHWVQDGADVVSAYYGRFPVPELRVIVSPRRGAAVNSGTTYGGRRIEIHLDPRARPESLARDWILVHEMFHLGFPTLPDDYEYLQEGLSDYLEPLARARAGNLTEEAVWREFVRGMPKGLPDERDGGLDGTHAWGRVYWGGCFFWLLVDLDIRERSGHTKSLDDAIRAIVDAGGTGDHEWTLERMIEVGDAATGTGSFARLHDRFGPAAVDPELDELWRRLGVVMDGGRVRFDEQAPLAEIRRSMTEPAESEAASTR